MSSNKNITNDLNQKLLNPKKNDHTPLTASKENINLDNQNFQCNENISFFKIFMMATPLDYFLMIFGSILGLISGAIPPLGNLFFGEMANDISNPENNNEIMDSAKKYGAIYLILGTILFFSASLGMFFWTITGERQVMKFKKKLFNVLIKQEPEWFDKINPYELNSLITNLIGGIQRAIGQKFFVIFYICAICIGGLIIGFVKSWQLSLILLGCFILTLLTGLILMSAMNKFTLLLDSSYSYGASLAEEALNSIKTVLFLNGQDNEYKKYSKSLENDGKDIFKNILKVGFCTGCFMFTIYFNYAVGCWAGSKLIKNEKNSSGEISTTFFVITSAGYILNGISPCMSAFNEAKISLGKILPIFERKPKIDINSVDGMKPENFQGEIEFKNVSYLNFIARKFNFIFLYFSLFFFIFLYFSLFFFIFLYFSLFFFIFLYFSLFFFIFFFIFLIFLYFSLFFFIFLYFSLFFFIFLYFSLFFFIFLYFSLFFFIFLYFSLFFFIFLYFSLFFFIFLYFSLFFFIFLYFSLFFFIFLYFSLFFFIFLYFSLFFFIFLYFSLFFFIFIKGELLL